METKSYWSSFGLPRFAPVSSAIQVDVVVIGAGLTGTTTAYLLKKAGAKVALLERHECAGADTGRTTAHLTYVTDQRLHTLVDSFGKDAAKAYWEGGGAAIDQIVSLVRDEKIACDFEWVPGYLHASLKGYDEKELKSLHKDAELARELGFDAEYLSNTPYFEVPGVRFNHQARFNPIKYLAVLLDAVHGQGSYVFEHSEAGKIESDPLKVHCGQFTV